MRLSAVKMVFGTDVQNQSQNQDCLLVVRSKTIIHHDQFMLSTDLRTFRKLLTTSSIISPSNFFDEMSYLDIVIDEMLHLT